MVIKNSDLRREPIRKMLEQNAGKSPDAGAIAEAALTTWREMAAHLTPLLGERGINALFRRTLHLMRTSFPGLLIPEGKGDSADLLANLKADLGGRETADAYETSLSLLVTFTELLATLIGGSLTGRLLCTAQVPQSPAIYTENISWAANESSAKSA